MLTLGMAFIGKPRLLMIDELSLGLAPAVVSQLLGIVRELRDAGTTVILVEQSVNVALTVADRAYFMEKGEIRFEGPTSELLERPDLLRSVFLRAAAKEVEAEEGELVSHSAAARRLAGPRGARHRPPVRRRPCARRRLVRRAAGRDPGLHRAQRRRQDDAVRRHLGLHAGRQRVDPPAARTATLTDLHDVPTHVRSWRGLGRSFQDGRLFPGLTVHEAIAVALEQHVDVRDPVAATLHLPSVQDSEEKVQPASRS